MTTKQEQDELLARLEDAINDVQRLHKEKIAFFEAKIILEQQLEAERKAHDDLKRSILDGSHPNLVLERKARKASDIQFQEQFETAVGLRHRAEAAEQRLASVEQELRIKSESIEGGLNES